MYSETIIKSQDGSIVESENSIMVIGTLKFKAYDDVAIALLILIRTIEILDHQSLRSEADLVTYSQFLFKQSLKCRLVFNNGNLKPSD